MTVLTNAHIGIDQFSSSYPEENTTPSGSGYGLMPGSEFPTALYVAVAAAFASMLGAAWTAFGADGGTDLDLAMVAVLGVVFLGIPAATHHTAATQSNGRQSA